MDQKEIIEIKEAIKRMVIGKKPDEIKRTLSELKKDRRQNKIRGFHGIVKTSDKLIEGLENVLKSFSQDKGRQNKTINNNMSEIFKCQKCGKEEKVAKISRLRKYCSVCRDLVKKERKEKRRALKMKKKNGK